MGDSARPGLWVRFGCCLLASRGYPRVAVLLLVPSVPSGCQRTVSFAPRRQPGSLGYAGRSSFTSGHSARCCRAKTSLPVTLGRSFQPCRWSKSKIFLFSPQIFGAMVCCRSAERITESQRGRGWKGPLWVIYSNPPAEAGSPTVGCRGPCPGGS